MKVKRSKVRYKRNAKTKKFIFIVIAVALLLAIGLGISLLMGELASGGEQSSAASTSSAPSAASQTTSEAVSSVPAVSSQPIAESLPIKAVSPDKAALTDLTALAAFCSTAKENGANTVVIDIKDGEGHLLYRNVGASTTEAAIYARLSTRDDADLTYTVYDDLDRLVKVIRDAGLQAAARINCFNDSYSGKSIPGSRCTLSGGTTWVDDSPANGGRSWLNPYSQSARAFNLAIAADCAAFGFDLIIADYVQFPVGYSVNRIDYGEQALVTSETQALGGFLSELTAHTDLPVWLTVRIRTSEGSREFAGNPYTYAPDSLAGFIAVLNAPENPRKDAAPLLDDAQLAAAIAALPAERVVLPCVITDTPSDVLTLQEGYVIMK